MAEELIKNLKDNDAEVRRTAAEELKNTSSENVIKALIDALGDPNRGVAEAAENSLLFIRGERVIKGLIPLLSSEYPNIRNFAFEILSEIGGDSLNEIIVLLKDDDKDIRKYAADVLGELAEPLSVTPLIEALDDFDVNIAAAAAESLGKVNDKRAIPELIKRLEGDVWMQCSVIKSLSMFDDPMASEEVYKIMPKIKGMALFSAISALGEVGNKTAIITLLNLLNEENKAFKGSIVNALEKIISREEDPSYSASLGKVEISELIELLSDQDVKTKLNTIIILGWLKNEDAVQPLVKELLEAEKRQDIVKEDIKQSSFKAIINIKPKDVSYIVSTLEAIDTPDEIKAELIDILGKLRADEALRAIIGLAESLSKIIRRAIARTLGKFDHPDSIITLKKLLKDPEGHTRGNSAESLGNLKVESAIDDLIAVFDDEYDDIRKLAALALAQIGTEPVINKLREISSRLSDSEKIKLALFALGRIDKTEALDILLKHIKDRDPKMRKVAVDAISEHRVDSCYEELIPLLDDEDEEVVVSTIKCLSKTRNNTVVKSLLSTLEDASHLKVKYAIVEALGNLNALQATEKLLELLDDSSSVMLLSTIEALGKIQDPIAREPLEKLCKSDDEEIAKTAKEALDRFDRGF